MPSRPSARRPPPPEPEPGPESVEPLGSTVPLRGAAWESCSRRVLRSFVIAPAPPAQDQGPGDQDPPAEKDSPQAEAGPVRQGQEGVVAEDVVVDQVGPGRGGAAQPFPVPIDAVRRD